MNPAREIATRHMNAALEEADTNKVSRDAVARIFFEQVLKIYRESRTPEDIAAELASAAENLDPDEDYMFMRP